MAHGSVAIGIIGATASRGLLESAEAVGLSRDDLNARAHIIVSVTNWMRAWFWRYEADEYRRIADRVVDVLTNGFSGAKSSWNTTQRELEWTLATGDSETGDSFLRAATLLVNEQGYRGASVDKISAKLNVTKGSFYHHNDNKQDLISECFERTFSIVRQALSLAESSTGSGCERACAAARVLVRYQPRRADRCYAHPTPAPFPIRHIGTESVAP